MPSIPFTTNHHSFCSFGTNSESSQMKSAKKKSKSEFLRLSVQLKVSISDEFHTFSLFSFYSLLLLMLSSHSFPFASCTHKTHPYLSKCTRSVRPLNMGRVFEFKKLKKKKPEEIQFVVYLMGRVHRTEHVSIVCLKKKFAYRSHLFPGMLMMTF